MLLDSRQLEARPRDCASSGRSDAARSRELCQSRHSCTWSSSTQVRPDRGPWLDTASNNRLPPAQTTCRVASVYVTIQDGLGTPVLPSHCRHCRGRWSAHGHGRRRLARPAATADVDGRRGQRSWAIRAARPSGGRQPPPSTARRTCPAERSRACVSPLEDGSECSALVLVDLLSAHVQGWSPAGDSPRPHCGAPSPATPPRVRSGPPSRGAAPCRPLHSAKPQQPCRAVTKPPPHDRLGWPHGWLSRSSRGVPRRPATKVQAAAARPPPRQLLRALPPRQVPHQQPLAGRTTSSSRPPSRASGSSPPPTMPTVRG